MENELNKSKSLNFYLMTSLGLIIAFILLSLTIAILSFSKISAAETKCDISSYLLFLITALVVLLCLSLISSYFILKTDKHIKNINNELFIQKEWLRMTLNGIGDGVIVVDVNQKVQFINPVTERLTGYTKEMAVGKEISEIFNIISEKTKQKVANPISRVITEGIVVEMANHTSLISKDGTMYSVADSAAPIKDSNGKLIGVIMVFRDVSKEKKISDEIAIKSSAIEASTTGILITNMEGIITYANSAYLKIFSFSTEKEIKGKALIEVELNRTKVIEMIDCLHKKGAWRSEFSTKRSDGTKIEVNVVSNVSFDEDKQPICIIATFEDISERKKAQLALEIVKISEDAAHEYADSIINTIREPLISLDQDLRVVSVSRSFYEFFKVKPEETLGQLIYDLGNKQWDIPKLRELLETILPQNTTFDNYEVEHDFAAIGKHIMLLNARQIKRVLGKEKIILLAIEDITERREIENGLKKAHEELTQLAKELKRTAQAKSEFLANMSHELRTPLNSINGFSEVLYDETFGTLNDKQKKYVNNVLTSGKHLLLLINQILDMAKVESGKMHLTLSKVHTKSLLTELSLLVADMVSKKSLKMVLEIDETLPDITADELKVKEILYNILSNAVKFTPEGGEIYMKAKKVVSEIEIVLLDTGIGIAAENIGKIFEGFFRVDTPYSRVTEGTGLGLPLSKKLVELHGGTFYVKSEGLNKGTLVCFTLPITQKEESQ